MQIRKNVKGGDETPTYRAEWTGNQGRVSVPARPDWYAVASDSAYQRYLNTSRAKAAIFNEDACVPEVCDASE